MSTETEEAKTALWEFLAAMRDWENKFATLFRPENGGRQAHGSQAKIELEPVYEKYVTEKDPNVGRRKSTSVGYPPEFDPDAEKVVAIEPASKRKVIIETLWAHPRVPSSTQKNRYTMVYKDDKWRLDKKEFYDMFENKWVKRVL